MSYDDVRRYSAEYRRAMAAQRNIRLGWCPCGGERADDCECFGAFRLSVAQGKVGDEPEVEREEEPES